MFETICISKVRREPLQANCYTLTYAGSCLLRAYFSLNIFYLLKCAKRIRHKLNKLMKSSPIYNKLQHYLIEHACI